MALLLIGLAIGRCLPNTWQTWVTVLAFSFAVVSLAYGGSPWGYLSMGIIWAKFSLVLKMSVFSVVILGTPFLAAWFAARCVTRASPQNGRSLIVCPGGGRLSEEVQDLEATWDRRGVGVELIIVFLLCIFPLILLSTWLAWNLGKGIAMDTFATLLSLAHMTGSLLLLVYLIRRRGESPQRFGFVFHCSVIPASVGLFLLFCTVYSAGYHLAYFLGIIDPDSILRQAYGPMADRVFALGWLRRIVFAPLFEETLVRAYLMRRLKDLGWGTAWVVVASTLIQTSYHTYQGGVAAATHIPQFLMFSLYYARYQNVLTVILAHSYFSLLWEAFGEQ